MSTHIIVKIKLQLQQKDNITKIYPSSCF